MRNYNAVMCIGDRISCRQKPQKYIYKFKPTPVGVFHSIGRLPITHGGGRVLYGGNMDKELKELLVKLIDIQERNAAAYEDICQALWEINDKLDNL